MASSSRSVWRNRDFVLLSGGATVNGVGDWLLELALPLYVYIETGSGFATAAVYIINLVIGVFFGPLGGSLVDRWRLRTTLVGTNLLQVLALAPLLLVESDRVWPVYLVAVLQGLISSVNDPASFALLPRLVPDDQLVAANSVMSAGGSIARLVGAAAGGIAIAAGGLTAVVVADAATFLVGALAAAMLSAAADRTATDDDPEEAADVSVRAGIAEVRSRPTVAALIGIQTFAMVGFGAFPVLFIVFVTEYLDGGGTEVGVIRASSALGGLIAATVIGRFAARRHPAALMVAGYGSFAVIAFAFVNAPPFTTALWVYLVLFAASGFPNVACQVGSTSTAQLLCPPAVLGRLGGLMSAATALGFGVGSVAAGVLLERFTARVLFNGQVAILALCAVLSVVLVARPFARSRGRREDRRDDRPVGDGLTIERATDQGRRADADDLVCEWDCAQVGRPAADNRCEGAVQRTGGPVARLHPSLQDLEDCGEPLSSAEMEVARALARLDDGWTVYVRPRIGLALPHFVAVNDDHGVCVIEVAGWLRGTHRQAADGGIECREIGGIWQRVPHPRFEADRHRTTIYDQYFALPGDPSEAGDAVRATVVMPRFSNRHARELLGHLDVDATHAAIEVWGGEGLHREIEAIVGGRAMIPLGSESIRRLRSHLITVGMPADPPPAVPLTAATDMIEQNPTETAMRRVRGPAGSGKSFGLTARAARLAAEGKRVLVLSFNVTLANHLSALVASRCRERNADPTLVACANFHTFCERVVQDAEHIGIHTVAPHGARWPDAIVARATQAFEGGFRRRYDAVLVDEGQDFTRAWWNLLRRHAVVEGGEMLLVADPTQNLYGRAGWLEDGEAAGFTDEWIELTDSYRMPIDLVPLTNEFAQQQLEGEALPAIVPTDRQDIVGACSGSVRRWTNVDGLADVGREIGREVVRLLREHPSLSPRDVVFLCEYHRDGEAAAAEIEAAGYLVHHLFSRDPDDPRRKRRYRFWPDADAVKGCTVHSFKGWSAHALVMGIGVDARSRHAAYISMTRVAPGTSGHAPYVSVINADKLLADLQSTFTSGHHPQDTAPDVDAIAAPA